MMVEVDEFLLICAFRYALGRASYAVGIVADDLIRLAPKMRLSNRDLIVREIDRAGFEVDTRFIGMRMDHERWLEVRSAMVAASS